MSQGTLSTYFAEKGKGRAEVMHGKDYFYIDYYDSNGVHFFKEEFPGKSLQYVEDAAENWTLGIKELYG